MTSIRSWPMLSLLPPNLANQVVQAFVFGGAGNEALVTLHSGDIYAIGLNENGCLGVGDSCSTIEPRKVEVLCQKTIVHLAYGIGPHVLAVTDTGALYSWGYGAYGQLGHMSAEKSIPMLVNFDVVGQRVVQVACGSQHSVALTSDGKVYSWGDNRGGQLGLGPIAGQPTPKKVLGLLADRHICSISCGQNFTVSLTKDGEIFTWGQNDKGQCGIGNATIQYVPCKVPIAEGKVISKALCGMMHVLALSDVGELYSWGANSTGQIGVAATINTSIPTTILAIEERWVDIAAHHYNNISAAMTVNGIVYIWGQCHGLTLPAPRKV